MIDMVLSNQGTYTILLMENEGNNTGNYIFNFHIDSNISNIDSTICSNESIIVNNTTYNQNNPTGTEVITDGNSNGCDSIININLSFYPDPDTTINPSLCSGESILINGTIYDEDNPTGMEILPNSSYLGCDSTIYIELTFNNEVVNNLNSTICQNESISVNGTVYDENNPSGTEIIPN